MRSYKQGKYLVFEREDGKEAKYDLSNGEIIGLRGKPVKSLQSQFLGVTMQDLIDSFEDENYRNFLDWISSKEKACSMNHLVCSIRRYLGKEQIFSSGITYVSSDFFHKISDIPKGLLNICREKRVKLTNELVNFYKKYPDLINNIAKQEFMTLSHELIIDSVIKGGEEADPGAYYWRYYNKFLNLVIIHKYDVITLVRYLDELMTYEGIENLYNLIIDLQDHAKMSKELSEKFEKYPRNFLTQHRILSRNYARLKAKFDEEKFAKTIDNDLSWTYQDWKIVIPTKTQDIKDEAIQQSNCVAGYIDGIIEGRRHIVFLRKKDKPEKSVVTVEIQNYNVVQSRGAHNSSLTAREHIVLKKYEAYLLALKKKRESPETGDEKIAE